MKVILLGLDGLRSDCLLFANTPNLNKLILNQIIPFIHLC